MKMLSYIKSTQPLAQLLIMLSLVLTRPFHWKRWNSLESLFDEANRWGLVSFYLTDTLIVAFAFESFRPALLSVTVDSLSEASANQSITALRCGPQFPLAQMVDWNSSLLDWHPTAALTNIYTLLFRQIVPSLVRKQTPGCANLSQKIETCMFPNTWPWTLNNEGLHSKTFHINLGTELLPSNNWNYHLNVHYLVTKGIFFHRQ